MSAAGTLVNLFPAIPANEPDVTLAPAVAANAAAPRRAPGAVRVVIREPEDAAAAGTTMKKLVQGFARIAVKHLRAANDSPAPIDTARAA